MKRLGWAVLVIGVWIGGTARAAAQVAYARGQDVSPTFDGWERNPDGTYNFYFGYFNRNTEEEVDIPIGPDNKFEEGGDRGQPTHFNTARRWWVFKVPVPKDWPKDRRLVWTLSSYGRTNQAKGWLQPEWEVDVGIMFRNSRDNFLFGGGGGEGAVADLDNRPPSITGSAAQVVTLPQTAALSVTATDDGRPTLDAEQRKGGRREGVRFRWMLYRGAGKVRFEPETSGPIATNPATSQTKVTFSAPGVYRLRAIASDGQAFSTYDVDVTVK